MKAQDRFRVQELSPKDRPTPKHTHAVVDLLGSGKQMAYTSKREANRVACVQNQLNPKIYFFMGLPVEVKKGC